MSNGTGGNVKNLTDSRKQALQALISSLSPNDSEENKLNEEQIEALSERLDQFLGTVDEGPEVRRNGKGEVLNEEGLPIIDISEPIDDALTPSQTSEAFLSSQDPPPLSSLSEQERLRLRIQRDRILDVLEEEERRESEKELERERIRTAEEITKMDAKSKAAAREMQKKMGKALLKNLAAQREKEEEEKKKAEEEVAARFSPQNVDDAHCKKPKKKVSFANLPDVDETRQKPKPPIVWGDVSVSKLKAGLPKAKLKTEALNNQPMKLEVVERIAGEIPESIQERDSDDESNPDVRTLEPNEEARHESSSASDGLSEDYKSEKQGDTSEEDEFDFSQANMQREIALEYFRLRDRVGSETRQAMASHTHDHENEWDQPRVPIGTPPTSKHPKSGVSRFKAACRADVIGGNEGSISLGASVLPQGKSATLQRAIHAGKLENGQLVGGGEDESNSEDDENETIKRNLEMLKNGIIVDDKPLSAGVAPGEKKDMTHVVTRDVVEREASGPPSSQARTSSSESRKSSQFKTKRRIQRPETGPIPGPSAQMAARISPVPKSAFQQPNSQVATKSVPEDASRAAQERQTASKKPRTVIPLPSAPPSHRPFVEPQIPPDPAVLNNMIVESPSFPAPGASTVTRTNSRPQPLVSEVRESIHTARRTDISEEPQPTQGTGKVSLFMADRLR